LDFLGFPWILSSESSLFNGLRGMKRGSFFLSTSPWRSQRRDGTGGRGHAEAQECHGASLTLFLIFCKRLPSAPFPLGRLNPKAARLSYDFSRWSGEKEPLGEDGSPLDSGEGRIGSTLTV
jgi:hypothetical protein